MVTNAEEPEAPPTTAERIDETMRGIIAGHPRGSVRRIVLYVITFVGLWMGPDFWPASVAALVSLTLLAMTDQLV